MLITVYCLKVHWQLLTETGLVTAVAVIPRREAREGLVFPLTLSTLFTLPASKRYAVLFGKNIYKYIYVCTYAVFSLFITLV